MFIVFCSKDEFFFVSFSKNGKLLFSEIWHPQQ
jgi:hypothetical protein